MTKNKTTKTAESVTDFLGKLGETQARDSKALVRLMARVTGKRAAMWGPSMIGFGEHHYCYESGREGDIFDVGFSPRKSAIVLYGLNIQEQAGALKKLGKVTMGKGCLYIKRLEDVDHSILERMIQHAVSRLASAKKV